MNFGPAVTPPSSTASPPEYRTQSLYQAAAWIILAALPYLRCELDPETNHAWFVFADAESKGSQLEREYLRTDPTVPIRQLRDVLDTLRDRVRMVTASGRRRVDNASLR